MSYTTKPKVVDSLVATLGPTPFSDIVLKRLDTEHNLILTDGQSRLQQPSTLHFLEKDALRQQDLLREADGPHFDASAAYDQTLFYMSSIIMFELDKGESVNTGKGSTSDTGRDILVSLCAKVEDKVKDVSREAMEKLRSLEAQVAINNLVLKYWQAIRRTLVNSHKQLNGKSVSDSGKSVSERGPEVSNDLKIDILLHVLMCKSQYHIQQLHRNAILNAVRDGNHEEPVPLKERDQDVLSEPRNERTLVEEVLKSRMKDRMGRKGQLRYENAVKWANAYEDYQLRRETRTDGSS
jgi:hypothetical protein